MMIQKPPVLKKFPLEIKEPKSLLDSLLSTPMSKQMSASKTDCMPTMVIEEGPKAKEI
jgi:hypothetical protein